MEIAVFGDTHVPSRAGEIPEWVRERVGRTDQAIHAGDFDSPEAYERVRELTDGDLTAVRGNMDPRSLDLPRVATLEAEGVRFVVTHGHGRGSYEDVVASAVREEGGDVGISGHTHEIRDERIEGVRYLNPGSATAASPAEVASIMTITVADGDYEVDLEKR